MKHVNYHRFLSDNLLSISSIKDPCPLQIKMKSEVASNQNVRRHSSVHYCST